MSRNKLVRSPEQKNLNAIYERREREAPNSVVFVKKVGKTKSQSGDKNR